ncbi:MAG: permease [Armatimonadota bacterium]
METDDENMDSKSQTPPVSSKPYGWRLAIIITALIALWILIFLHLDLISDFITYSLLHMARGSGLGKTVSMFIYQAPRMLMTLVLVISIIGIIRSFFAPERIRHMLAGRGDFVGSVIASLIGIVTPFCSCSAIPLFIGFLKAGVPLGVTFSFLIAAPMINEIVIAMLLNMFDLKVTILYVSTGMIIAIAAGLLISHLKMERFIEGWVAEIRIYELDTTDAMMTWENRVYYGWAALADTFRRIWIYVLIGIGIGAVIHGYAPEGYLSSLMGKTHWWSVPMAVLVGVPIYSSAAGIIPITQALMEKGAAVGTTLAFMMSVIGLSLPEVIILRKVIKWQLIAVFVGVVALGILLVGYLLNAVIQ